MKIFIFDTETTGFINKKDPNLDVQPHIIQFAGIQGTIKDGKFEEIKRINAFVKPPIAIPFGASQVHHIYDIDLIGAKTITEQIDEFLSYINDSDVIVGHNIEYDESMIKLELRRLGREYDYRPKKVICTMKETTDFCELEGNGKRFKYPKLGELHKKLFGEYFAGAHDAIVDVEATVSCFVESVNKGVIKLNPNRATTLSLF